LTALVSHTPKWSECGRPTLGVCDTPLQFDVNIYNIN